MPPDTPEDVNEKDREKQFIPDQRPTKHWGYFVGMLTKDISGSKEFSSAYRSRNIQDFESDIVAARDSSFKYIELDGSTDYDDPRISSLETPDGAISSVSLPVSIQHGELGHNAYMEWGYWLQKSAMSNGTNDFYFDNKGYYVFGDYTTDNRMSDLADHNVSGTYSGSAHGTFWTPKCDADMSGTFSSHVNFASRSITDFNVYVSGGGHSASISGASGAFDGSSSQFAIVAGSGSWQIDDVTNPNTKEAGGSVYGPNGDAMGGAWEIHNGTSHAVGVFQGTR